MDSSTEKSLSETIVDVTTPTEKSPSPTANGGPRSPIRTCNIPESIISNGKPLSFVEGSDGTVIPISPSAKPDSKHLDVEVIDVPDMASGNSASACIQESEDDNASTPLVADDDQAPLIPVDTVFRVAIPSESSSSGVSSSDSTYSCYDIFYGCICCQTYFCDYYNNNVRRVTSTPFLLPFYILLMCFPISLCYMSVKYFEDCPLGQSTPLFLFLIGFVGSLCLLVRILDIFHLWLCPTAGDWSFPSYIAFVSMMAIILLLISEILIVLRMQPNFQDTASDKYCEPTFYYFSIYANYAILAIVILVLVLHVPSILCIGDAANIPTIPRNSP